MQSDVEYRVVTRKRNEGKLPRIGELIIHHTASGHPSGQIILRCPFCGSLQFRAASVEGPADAPTVKTPITCGCKVKCAKTFRIRSGRVHDEAPEPRTDSIDLSEGMKEAGVFYPPRGE